MSIDSKTVNKTTYELRSGINGSGREIFFLHVSGPHIKPFCHEFGPNKAEAFAWYENCCWAQ
jgi:hypothetical protein